jgi:hypothetical protein
MDEKNCHDMRQITDMDEKNCHDMRQITDMDEKNFMTCGR